MSADTASPSRGGVGVVGDRYRLVERIAAGPGTEFWRAQDQLLARPVALTVHTPGGDDAREFLAQAHRISTLTHPTVTRVYDAVDEGHRAYVVSEWVEGATLSRVLSEESLDPNDAAAMVAKVAEAVAQAHAAGVAFGELRPDNIFLSRRGTVLSRLPSGRATPTDDIRGLGALLYATLTGRWPLPDSAGATALRPPSMVAGRLASPRQVRGGVPHDLSTLTMRALDPADPRGIRSAETVATVLNERMAPMGYSDPPQYALPPEPPPRYDSDPYGAEPPRPREPEGPPPRGPYPPREREPFEYERSGHYQRHYAQYDGYGSAVHDAPVRRRSRAVTLTAIAAGVLAVALVGWLIGSVLRHVPNDAGGRAEHPIDLSNAPSGPTSAPTTQPIGQPVKPAGVNLYDPPPGDGQDNPEDAQKAMDGNPTTSWKTVHYKRNPQFGNLKPGEGLLFDLGSAQSIQQIKIQTAQPGADIQIRAGDAPGGPLDSYTVAGNASSIGASTTVTVSPGAGQHRYWLVWITKLVPDDGDFQASISEVQFN